LGYPLKCRAKALTDKERLLREKGFGFGERTLRASGLPPEEFSALQKSIARLRDNLLKASEQKG
jgi:hypothetical protein